MTSGVIYTIKSSSICHWNIQTNFLNFRSKKNAVILYRNEHKTAFILRFVFKGTKTFNNNLQLPSLNYYLIE